MKNVANNKFINKGFKMKIDKNIGDGIITLENKHTEIIIGLDRSDPVYISIKNKNKKQIRNYGYDSKSEHELIDYIPKKYREIVLSCCLMFALEG